MRCGFQTDALYRKRLTFVGVLLAVRQRVADLQCVDANAHRAMLV